MMSRQTVAWIVFGVCVFLAGVSIIYGGYIAKVSYGYWIAVVFMVLGSLLPSVIAPKKPAKVRGDGKCVECGVNDKDGIYWCQSCFDSMVRRDKNS